jgi:hypothetical protein
LLIHFQILSSLTFQWLTSFLPYLWT